MKIETTLGELVEATSAAKPGELSALDRVLAVKLDAKTRYHAFKLSRLVEQETKHFHDVKNKFVEEHGTEREPDKVKQILPNSPAMPLLLAELTKLYEIPVTIDWGPLTRAMLDPYQDITGKDWRELGPLFELEPKPITEVTNASA